MDISIPDYIGFTGVALLIVTYALLQLERIDPKGFWYSFNNMIVAILVSVSLWYTPNLASWVIEFFWFIISVYGIVMYFRRQNVQG
jgi:membrane protein implicated in regulation of membrane protease activity